MTALYIFANGDLINIEYFEIFHTSIKLYICDPILFMSFGFHMPPDNHANNMTSCGS